MIKILEKQTFSDEVELYFLEKNCELIDALMFVLTKYNLEYHLVNRLITPRLKTMLEFEAKKKRLLKDNEIATLDI